MQGQYEFNDQQNAIIAKLASRMRLAGIAQLVFGAVDLLGSCHIQRTDGGFSAQSGSGPFAIALIISAIFTISAAGSFSKIVSTQGWDVSHLMVALRSYSKATFATFVTYVIMAVFFVLILLLLLVLILAFASLLAGSLK